MFFLQKCWRVYNKVFPLILIYTTIELSLYKLWSLSTSLISFFVAACSHIYLESRSPSRPSYHRISGAFNRTTRDISASIAPNSDVSLSSWMRLTRPDYILLARLVGWTNGRPIKRPMIHFSVYKDSRIYFPHNPPRLKPTFESSWLETLRSDVLCFF